MAAAKANSIAWQVWPLIGSASTSLLIDTIIEFKWVNLNHFLLQYFVTICFCIGV